MAGFRFLFPELIQETQVLTTLSKRFLEPNSREKVFPSFLSNLRSIGRKPEERVYSLKLQCLRTIPSDQYDRKAGKEIYAVISGTWDLRRLGRREIEFCGIASTKIELYASDDPGKRLAMWRLELGDEKSPGCYVHAHILGALPIPRLPSLFVTPMSAIEFVLGELFQRDWAQVVASDNKNVNRWRNIQTDRLQKLFAWYKDQIENADSSPWMALKKAKPEDGMFLPKSRRRRS
ncbi:MAG: hypothetical protein J4F29_04350 [Candidatus Latescibacteria bacterium]|nr:hypothetical protein [Candidatus Latescibacterota bacterium]